MKIIPEIYENQGPIYVLCNKCGNRREIFILQCSCDKRKMSKKKQQEKTYDGCGHAEAQISRSVQELGDRL